MSLIEWNENMSVGVKLLDTDHQKLIGMLNQLHDAMKAGHGKDSLGKTLDALVSYTKVHFGREEQFFAQTGYPEAAEHKKQHDELTRQVLDIQKKFKNGAQGLVTVEVMVFLKDWLVNHIQGTDKKYGPYLNSKGIH
jgi:hemerythrin